MWIGISDKENTEPLSKDTITGKFIYDIEQELNINGYKTNLVGFVPLDKSNKIRYPTKEEINDNWSILLDKINKYKPNKIVLLGNIVIKQFEKEFNIKMKNKFKEYNVNDIIFIPIYHPSYICVYKKKDIGLYKYRIVELLK